MSHSYNDQEQKRGGPGPDAPFGAAQVSEQLVGFQVHAEQGDTPSLILIQEELGSNSARLGHLIELMHDIHLQLQPIDTSEPEREKEPQPVSGIIPGIAETISDQARDLQRLEHLIQQLRRHV